jgi:hypothetical protein
MDWRYYGMTTVESLKATAKAIEWELYNGGMLTREDMPRRVLLRATLRRVQRRIVDLATAERALAARTGRPCSIGFEWQKGELVAVVQFWDNGERRIVYNPQSRRMA